MTINQRIRERRMQLGISQTKLAEAVGYKGRSSVNKLELTNSKIDPEKIPLFAKALHTSPAYLMGWIKNPDLTHDNVLALEEHSSPSNNNIAYIPILSEVAAGIGSYADVDNWTIGVEAIPRDWIVEGEDYVLLKVKGDSMMPRFEENDLLLIKCQPSVDSGSFAIAIIDDEAGVVKKVIYGDTWIELHSLNPKYPIRSFENSEVTRVRIFGLVKKSIRNYN